MSEDKEKTAETPPSIRETAQERYLEIQKDVETVLLDPGDAPAVNPFQQIVTIPAPEPASAPAQSPIASQPAATSDTSDAPSE